MSAEYNRIMVTLDGSAFAGKALSHAERIAAAVGAELLLYRVVPDMGDGLEDPAMRVGEYMTRRPFTVSEQTSLKEAVPMLGRNHIRHLPVTNGSRLVGIVTDRDIRRAQPSLLSAIGREDYEQVLVDTPVGRIMTKEPVTVTENTPLFDAVRLIVERKFGSLPVVRGEELIGIFTEIDALNVLLEKISPFKTGHQVEASGEAETEHKNPLDAADCEMGQLARNLRDHHIVTEWVVEAGPPAKKIVDYVHHHEIDLLVMSTHGRTGVARAVFGSVAQDVLASVKCPILLIQPQD